LMQTKMDAHNQCGLSHAAFKLRQDAHVSRRVVTRSELMMKDR
jgi:hypothetical protein